MTKDGAGNYRYDILYDGKQVSTTTADNADEARRDAISLFNFESLKKPKNFDAKLVSVANERPRTD